MIFWLWTYWSIEEAVKIETISALDQNCISEMNFWGHFYGHKTVCFYSDDSYINGVTTHESLARAWELRNWQILNLSLWQSAFEFWDFETAFISSLIWPTNFQLIRFCCYFNKEFMSQIIILENNFVSQHCYNDLNKIWRAFVGNKCSN